MPDDPANTMFLWTNDWAVGVREIDADHQRLCALAQSMHRAMLDGRSKAFVEELLARLLDYTDYHFTHEERLMARIGYPELRQHQRQHEKLRSEVRAMQARAASGEVTMTIEVMLFLMNWLRQHTAASDQRITAYMKRSSVGPATGSEQALVR
ncbi:MAG TPA: bacteriohemerythrin [Bryobacteraceae bacterium]|nr:bacteriohemerythrin [Bryobacteraceae bacterium]